MYKLGFENFADHFKAVENFENIKNEMILEREL